MTERTTDPGVVSIETTNLVPRVSRHELALNRFVWLATGSMFTLFGVASLVATRLPYGFDDTRLIALAAFLCGIGILFLRTSPPPVGSIYNHVVLALVYIGTAAGMVAFQPYGAAAIGPAMFIGPLTASRLIDRRQIALHFTAATVLLMAPSFAGIINVGTMLAGLTAVPALWVLGSCAAVVLEAAEAQGEELENLVRRDPLTGVGNRRMLSERLVEELSRHTRSRRPLSVIALDLNGFKALNDTVGHAAGDDLLRAVATALDSISRRENIVVRQGGDEFCVVLTETGAADANRVAIAITKALAEIELYGAAVSTGIGIASFPDDGEDADTLLQVADERLRIDKLDPGPRVQPLRMAI